MAACGSPNARVMEKDEVQRMEPAEHGGEPSEAEKIRALIDEVRKVDAVFVRGDETFDGATMADELEHRVTRLTFATARQFVDAVAAIDRSKAEPLRVRLTDGTVLEARDWYLAALDEMEGATRAPRATGPTRHDPNAPVTLGILDALTIVERSRETFVAPARKLPSGKTKGKRKEYTAPDFAEMLRKKWEFLGADVRDLETFIDEIATDAFSTMEPYRVLHEDGSEEEFRGWLLAQLDARRAALAKGGAP